MSSTRRLDAVVRGRVQGVGFRFFVLHTAAAADLDGWVANQADGSVRCRAEGSPAALEALLEALRVGPSGARVEAVDVVWSEPTRDLGPFTVRSGSHPGD